MNFGSRDWQVAAYLGRKIRITVEDGGGQLSTELLTVKVLCLNSRYCEYECVSFCYNPSWNINIHVNNKKFNRSCVSCPTKVEYSV